MVYMYHSFLIHSSADGHLGCFHVLAMINSAVAVSFQCMTKFTTNKKKYIIKRQSIRLLFSLALDFGDHN